MGFFERLRIAQGVYRRIRFFKRLYPLRHFLADAFWMPFDRRVEGRRLPLRHVTVFCTRRCNIRCRMCYLHKEVHKAKDLDAGVFSGILRGLGAERPAIQFTGGEPLLHPEIVRLVREAREHGSPVQIFSNGVAGGGELLDGLIAAGLDYLDLSLLGDESLHDEIAGVPGAYRKLLATLERLSRGRGGLKVVLNFTVSEESFGLAGHALELVRRFRLDGLRIQHLMYLRPEEAAAHGRATEACFGRVLEAQGIERTTLPAGMGERLRTLQTELRAAAAEGIHVQWAPGLTGAEIDHWYSGDPFRTARTCYYPWRGMVLDADAVGYPCTKIFLPLGDASRQPLGEIFNGETMRDFRRRLRRGLFPGCSRCCKL